MPEEFFAPVFTTNTPPVYRYFDGEIWRESESHKTTPLFSPVDSQIAGYTQSVTEKEIDAVMERATKAQPLWESVALNKRIAMMHLAADWIRHFQEYLTTLLTIEIGKTHDEAKGEIVRTADLIDYYAQEVQSIRGETLDSDNFIGFEKGKIAMIEHVAHGVVLAIAPFNYPVNLSASKIVPALLMGNSVVLKPPTLGALSALHLIRIFEKAGVPKGVLSAVTGVGNDIGNYIVSHPKVSMVAFTGSSDTGIAIAGKAAMKPLLFECGGNNPTIVLPDADMHAAAREIVKGAFQYSGQRCTGIKYVLVMPNIRDQLLPIIKEAMVEMVKSGDPRSTETKFVGPVISEEAAKHIEEVINEAIKQGAQLFVGGTRTKALIEPTILLGVKPAMRVIAKETFGPVMSFVDVASVDEAIQIVNASDYGLQASVFTKDEGSGIVVAQQLNVGTVQINGSPQRGPDHFPFLGVKHSGVGVQGVRYSLEAMSRVKSVVLNKPQ